MSERIEIRTVADFVAIPAEKIEHCLKDFALWLSFREAWKATIGEIEGVSMPEDKFIWIDDGKHDAHISIIVHNREAAK